MPHIRHGARIRHIRAARFHVALIPPTRAPTRPEREGVRQLHPLPPPLLSSSSYAAREKLRNEFALCAAKNGRPQGCPKEEVQRRQRADMLPLGHGSCQGGGSVVTAAVGLAFVASAAAFAPVPVGRVPASPLQLQTAISPGALRAPRRRALVSRGGGGSKVWKESSLPSAGQSTLPAGGCKLLWLLSSPGATRPDLLRPGHARSGLATSRTGWTVGGPSA